MREACSLAVVAPESHSTADIWRLCQGPAEVYKEELSTEAWPSPSVKDNLGVTSSLCGVVLVHSRCEHCFEPLVVADLPLLCTIQVLCLILLKLRAEFSYT